MQLLHPPSFSSQLQIAERRRGSNHEVCNCQSELRAINPSCGVNPHSSVTGDLMICCICCGRSKLVRNQMHIELMRRAKAVMTSVLVAGDLVGRPGSLPSSTKQGAERRCRLKLAAVAVMGVTTCLLLALYTLGSTSRNKPGGSIMAHFSSRRAAWCAAREMQVGISRSHAYPLPRPALPVPTSLFASEPAQVHTIPCTHITTAITPTPADLLPQSNCPRAGQWRSSHEPDTAAGGACVPWCALQ